MPYTPIKVDTLKDTLERIEKLIYTKVAPLTVTAFVTKEPVTFSERMTGQRLDIQPGEKWGELWDCAWFRFQGQIPHSAAGSKIVLLLDVNGELCLVDEEGTPTQGLTNVNSEFDLSLGLPGKRVAHIAASASGGEVIDLWADAGNNDLFGYYRSGKLKEADIAICNEETRQLYYDYEVLLDLAVNLGDQSARRAKILQALYDVHLLLKGVSEDPIAQARRILAPQLSKQGGDPTLTATAIGHAHIDLAWLWPIRETYRKGARTFATALRMMEQYPDYVFGASQPQLYEWIKQQHPKLYEQIKKRIAEGRWEVQGAMWVEPDSNIAGGEALVRQILYGKRFFRQEFGQDMKMLWVPDIFGYSASLPQLLQKSGVEYVMTQKLSWNVHNDHPHHTFFWEGLDGSRVLTHLPPEDTYNGPALPRSILKAERDYLDKNVSDHCFVVFGIGDGGGGPGEEHLERLSREQNLQGLIPVKQEPALNFFEKLANNKERYKTWKGELYLEKHQGTFTSQARNKRYNRKIEKALRELEFAASLNYAYGNEYPSEELDVIWKEVLLYQFHDILPGSSIKRVFDESLARYEILLARVNVLTQQAYQGLASGIRTPEAGRQAVIFNSLPWERSEWTRIQDQWVRATVPSMGYQMIDTLALPPVTSIELKAADDVLENELIKVTFGENGSIRSIVDKVLGREALAAGGLANVLSIYADDGDAWDFPEDYAGSVPAKMALTESVAYVDGPQAVVKQIYHYGKSVLTQKIILTAGSKRIDFDTDVDWQEDGKMLRASFPVNVYAEQVNCEIQFGHLKRQTHRNTLWDYAKDEICAHQWIDLSQPDFGVALLNDCKYGYSVNRNVMDINLLRSPSHPDPTCDRARHQFVYAILPHAGDFIQAEVFKEGYAMNSPLTSVLASPEAGAKANNLQEQYSSFEIEGGSVMIEAVKKAEDEDGVIVRLYETSGGNADIHLAVNLPNKGAALVDLMENTLESLNDEGGKYKLSFAPFEIKSVLVRLSN
ncbi:alpha-mannosidase [Cohnella silvisoli]|uniref:Glycoside hydrolase family 38 C-terminal domain-containing protein n=1 Tax=Cohnella silvisoli TaxID=2873699 RepID=A0ABV1KQD1_9BACL|nr:glycoside hydrolase family 38 C-terminal domain-containing protein [Cohnella silvisoli]MCD9022051.1 alpha-mannosidase [Cohnella silvisoli]